MRYRKLPSPAIGAAILAFFAMGFATFGQYATKAETFKVTPLMAQLSRFTAADVLILGDDFVSGFSSDWRICGGKMAPQCREP